MGSIYSMHRYVRSECRVLVVRDYVGNLGIVWVTV